MRTAQTVLTVIQERGKQHKPIERVYKLLFNRDFYLNAYITNLIYASVDPKTVQYLAGHENSKVTMDIYAKVKYNKPAQLHGVINRAIDTSKKDWG